jgi:hypothetical protein
MSGDQPVVVVARELPLAAKVSLIGLAVASLVGIAGLVSYARDANFDATAARTELAAVRATLAEASTAVEGQTDELRCRSAASIEVLAGIGTLLAGISQALEESELRSPVVRAHLAELRMSLDDALAVQATSQITCKENP